MIYDMKKIPERLRKYFTDAPEIGSEPKPDCSIGGQAFCGECFVCVMRNVFRQVKRVIRDDGTCWLNLGDSYASGTIGRNDAGRNLTGDGGNKLGSGNPGKQGSRTSDTDTPSGNLCGIPFRVALALQADGWVLRQDIIWHKPSPMPESVINRCTKAHEYVFLLTKGTDYYYDAEAIKDDAKRSGEKPGGNLKVDASRNDSTRDMQKPVDNVANKRSVWTVSAQGYPGAHFATFPPKLIEPMILAGTSEKGCCPHCGNPWKRILRKLGYTKSDTDRTRGNGKEGGTGGAHDQGSDINKTGGGNWPTKTLGWHPTCRCGVGKTPAPCVVLDPFMGSGTSGEVALKLGRAAVGIDLNQEYLDNNAITRINRAWHQYQLSREVRAGL